MHGGHRPIGTAGGLATSIGLPVIKTLAAHPALAQHSAALLDRLQAKIEQLQRSGLVAVQPSQHQRRTSLGSFPGLLGLSTLTSDAHAAASQVGLPTSAACQLLPHPTCHLA